MPVTRSNLDQSICSDGEICTVIKTWRDVRVGTDPAWFADKFEKCSKIMTRWMTVMDAEVGSLSSGAVPSADELML